MKRTLTFTGKLLRLAFWVVILYSFSLFFHQQELPASWLSRLCDGLSTTNVVFHCEGMSFGIRHGLQLRGIRVFDSTRRNPLLPAFSAESISVWPFERRVRLVDPRFPRLGDGYYDGTAPDVSRWRIANSGGEAIAATFAAADGVITAELHHSDGLMLIVK